LHQILDAQGDGPGRDALTAVVVREVLAIITDPGRIAAAHAKYLTPAERKVPEVTTRSSRRDG
jgi:hypothetical protein